MPHDDPVYPGKHSHRNLFSSFKQVAPFSHGLLAHSFMSGTHPIYLRPLHFSLVNLSDTNSGKQNWTCK